jgi:hypothetical protein
MKLVLLPGLEGTGELFAPFVQAIRVASGNWDARQMNDREIAANYAKGRRALLRHRVKPGAGRRPDGTGRSAPGADPLLDTGYSRPRQLA